MRLGILCGGGPAPGMNSVISAATIEARNSGWEVLGIVDGFQHLIEGRIGEARPLSITDVSRIHLQGGSIIRTSRANPTVRDEGAADPDWRLHACLESLRKLGIGALVTIGGDDTAFSASRLAAAAGGDLRVAHVPKTIDNDLPLPGGTPTFGFETARSVGVQIVNKPDDRRHHHPAVVPGGGHGPLGRPSGPGHREGGRGHAHDNRRGIPARRAHPAVAPGGHPGDLDAQAGRSRPSVRRGGTRRGHRAAPPPGRARQGHAGGRAGRARPRPAGRARAGPPAGEAGRSASESEKRRSRSRARTSATSCGARPPSRSTSSTPATSATAPSTT